jgi:hypothetical protein
MALSSASATTPVEHGRADQGEDQRPAETQARDRTRRSHECDQPERQVGAGGDMVALGEGREIEDVVDHAQADDAQRDERGGDNAVHKHLNDHDASLVLEPR